MTDAPFDRANPRNVADGLQPAEAGDGHLPVARNRHVRAERLAPRQSDPLNAGLRYDIDLNLRLNDFYRQALDDPTGPGLDRFISRDRGTDTNNVQPRLGATWDSPRRRHADRPRRLGRVRHAQPPVVSSFAR